jgi:hypothetical protein
VIVAVFLPDIDAHEDRKNKRGHSHPAENDTGDGHSLSFNSLGVLPNFSQREIPKNQSNDRTNPIDPENSQYHARNRHPAGRSRRVRKSYRVQINSGTWSKQPIFAVTTAQRSVLNRLIADRTYFHLANLCRVPAISLFIK